MSWKRRNPLVLQKWLRFKAARRGFYSAMILLLLVILSLGAEFFVNNKALMVRYQGSYYFPVVSAMVPGTTFGFDYEYETQYRDLDKRLTGDDFVILPLIPYSSTEIDSFEAGVYPPTKPSFNARHFLGTDTLGRDVLARLIYGFRTALFFSLVLVLLEYAIGIVVGCFMGLMGGKTDLILQRIIEIWSNIPFLYVVIIISSIMVPTIMSLIGIMVFFGWMAMTWFMRTATYRQKSRDFVKAAETMGASTARLIFRHIIPTSIGIVITFLPFAIAGGIVSLTSLDFLGFGVPAPAASWGDLLKQGTANLEAYWIVWPVVLSMVFILVLITFIGEAVREAFDPKTFITYR